MSTALVRAGTGRPGTASSVAPPVAAPSLKCNRCEKPLATTCFLCACDCIFCEECTYSHFEHSSQCPKCHRTLSENDFTELVVAEAGNSMADLSKTSLQALFSKQSNNGPGGNLPFSDLCMSLLRQIDCVKQSTKFLLKQLLMDSGQHKHAVHRMARMNESLKRDFTHFKQQQHTKTMELQQAVTDLQNKLKAREEQIAGQSRMLDQFRQAHNGVAGNRGKSLDPHHIPPASSSGRLGGDRLGEKRSRQEQEPPLRGMIVQKEAQKAAQQQALNARMQPKILGSFALTSSHGALTSSHGMRRSNSLGNGQRAQPLQGQPGQPVGPMLARPFSGNSTGSLPPTPRIRDLSSNTGYNFSASGQSAPQGQHLNKRRRGGNSRGGTPSSLGGGSHRHSMSPNTAFTLNQGPHSVAGQGWRGHSNGVGGYSRR